MYQELINSKKKTFCQLLLLEGTDEVTLLKVSEEWVSFLRNYYNSTIKLIPQYLPFYHEDFLEICTLISGKYDIGSLSIFARPNFKEAQILPNPLLFLPIQKEDIFKYTVRGEGLDNFSKAKGELDKLPNGVVYGSIKDGKVSIFAHLTPNEIKNKLSLSLVSVQLEELRLFCSKCKYLSFVDGYIIPDDVTLSAKWDKGLVVGVYDTFFDIRYWEK